MIYVGVGQEDVDMYRGNFKITDYVTERFPLKLTDVIQTADTVRLCFESYIIAKIKCDENLCTIDFEQKDDRINRFWFRVAADKEEKCYGCGEQMSYFNLRGRNFPIWTSEPGVGRDKTTYVTWRSDVENKAGGDYYNTNYPQPTFVSTNKYYLHVDSTAYADFDFRNDSFHELQICEVPKQIRIECADTYLKLLERLTAYFGRQPKLPDWVYNGLIIGVQGGNERSFGLLDKTLDKNIKVAGIWCQDWCGKRVTSFGKRLQWDWKYHKEMYPDLPKKIKEINAKGIKFLGYVNPYLVNDGELYLVGLVFGFFVFFVVVFVFFVVIDEFYKEGKEKGYFATKADGSDYLVDFGEFYCGVVDLTNPEAFEWFKDIIKEYTLGIGIDGWMADFGEYLPTDDICLYSGKSPMIEHNHWPVLWAKCNYEAVKESGKLGDVVYFMRAGGAGSQKYCGGWTGDNHSIWAHIALSLEQVCNLSVSGLAMCGSDIGGFGSDTTPELLVRFYEAAVFVPFFRNHSAMGTRRQEPWQFDETTIDAVRKTVKLRYRFIPYIYDLAHECEKTGAPIVRPLVYEYPVDKHVRNISDEYMLGSFVLVAPVIAPGKEAREVYLPDGDWYDYYTGEKYSGGRYILADAPLDKVPVFIKAGAIIPVADGEIRSTEDITEDKISILTYPGKGDFVLYQDDNETFAYRNGEYNAVEYTLDGETLEKRVLHKGL